MVNDEYKENIEKLRILNPHYFSKKEKDRELTPLEQEDNEDEMIRIMHKRFLDGQYTQYFDYQNDIDENE